MKKLILFIIICIASLIWVSAFSEFGAPSEFGNASNTTCFIGGDFGIVNCTGVLIGSDIAYAGGTSVNDTIIFKNDSGVIEPKSTQNMNFLTGNINNVSNMTALRFFGIYDWIIQLGISTRYLFFNGTDLGFNETTLNSTIRDITKTITFNATTIEILSGTGEGTNESIRTPEDGDVFNVSESAGANPMVIVINFTDVSTFSTIILREHYETTSGHTIKIGLELCSDGSYEEEFPPDITGMDDFAYTLINVLDPENHVCGGNVSLRLRHVDNGNPAHQFHLDYAALQSGPTTVVAQEVDPLAFHKSGDVTMEGDSNWGGFDLVNVRNVNASGNVSGSISAADVNRDIATDCPDDTYQTGNGDNLSVRICSSLTTSAVNGTIWNITGNNLYPSDLSKNIGIGTTTPDHKLEVDGNISLLDSSTNQLLLPQNNSPSNPAIAFGDGDSGIYEQSDDTISISFNNGNRQFVFFDDSTGFVLVGPDNSPQLLMKNSLATNPNIVPSRTDIDTGIGWAGNDNLSLVSGGVEGLRIKEIMGDILVSIFGNLSVNGTVGNSTHRYTWADLNATDGEGGAAGIWTNVSGTATYPDNVNITGNVSIGTGNFTIIDNTTHIIFTSG